MRGAAGLRVVVVVVGVRSIALSLFLVLRVCFLVLFLRAPPIRSSDGAESLQTSSRAVSPQHGARAPVRYLWLSFVWGAMSCVARSCVLRREPRLRAWFRPGIRFLSRRACTRHRSVDPLPFPSIYPHVLGVWSWFSRGGGCRFVRSLLSVAFVGGGSGFATPVLCVCVFFFLLSPLFPVLFPLRFFRPLSISFLPFALFFLLCSALWIMTLSRRARTESRAVYASQSTRTKDGTCSG